MSDNLVEKIFETESVEQMAALFGSMDRNARLIERELAVHLINRDNCLKVIGPPENVDQALSVVSGLVELLEGGDTPTDQTILYLVTLAQEGAGAGLASLSRDVVCITGAGKPVKAKTHGQREYVKCIDKNTVCFGIGPAGTGKTYLAVAMAVNAFRKKQAGKIILTRPAVEAGEKLGFLPGDLHNKVDPYLRPLYDALSDMLGAVGLQKYMERGSIEVAPLAYMRGRTLDDAFIILDEAQNTTHEQMKMFLTRIGYGSKAVVTGDVTQMDLPDGKRSGLKEAARILKGIDDLEFFYLTTKDVVRHPLVQKIITAYEKANKN